MGWLSILPPLLAISVAIWKREVILALLLALFCAEFLLHGHNPTFAFTATLERCVAVFHEPDNARILMFSLLIGAFLALVRRSGGVSAFVAWVLGRGYANNPRRVGLLTTLLGVVIFIESNLSVLASGIFAQSLFDKFKMSRARLAFIIDATCAPVSVLILLNAWGAYVQALLSGYALTDPVSILINSIPLNFYALLILCFAFYTAWSGKVLFSLARHEANPPRESIEAVEESKAGKAYYFLLPLACLIGGILGFMYLTGHGKLLDGSGSSSALYATILACLAAYVILRIERVFNHQEMVKLSFSGMSDLLPLVSIVLLALALGNSMKELGTGEFIAGMISGNLPLWAIPATVFLAAALTSFTTGTSWGTFALMIPVAMPVALNTGLPPSLLLAAVLGGGVFGDHCSPISDSTILSSLASGSDHLEHVRTQLPYALLAALLSLILFSATTFWL